MLKIRLSQKFLTKLADQTQAKVEKVAEFSKNLGKNRKKSRIRERAVVEISKNLIASRAQESIFPE